LYFRQQIGKYNSWKEKGSLHLIKIQSMKKAILFHLLAFSCQFLSAQYCGSSGPSFCAPTGGPVNSVFDDPNTTPCAVQGTPYSHAIQFTMFSSFNFQGLQSVDSIEFVSIDNLPCGMCWSVNQTDKRYTANEDGCLSISGTTLDAIGQYKLAISLKAWINGFANGIPLSANFTDQTLGIRLFLRVKASGSTCVSVDTSASGNNLAATQGGCSNISCNMGRYLSFVFPNVTTTTVTYTTANSTNLQMDVYQPSGDTLLQRPVIVFAHGGSFIGGSRTNDNVVVDLCTNFAKRGYVCASIDYRLGNAFQMLDSLQALDVMIKAISDAKSAVRYFRKDAATTNTFKVNPNLIYGGGNSSGAVIFMHIGYIDSLNECPLYLKNIFNNNGGFDGNSGNTGYSSNINAVINLAGDYLFQNL
jgi:hypothetical protein